MWEAYRYFTSVGDKVIEMLVYAPSEAARRRTFVVHAAYVKAGRR